MSEELPQLSPEIASLLAQEKEGYRVDPHTRAEVLSHVEWAAALAAPPPLEEAAPSIKTAAAAAKGAGAAVTKKLVIVGLAAFVAGAGAGGGVVARVTSSRSAGEGRGAGELRVASTAASPSREIPAVASAEPTAPAVDSAPPAPAVAPPSPPSETGAPSASSPPPRAHAGGDLVRERELLDAARAALAHGRAADAMESAERHARLWPHGALTEDRELIAIQSLVALDPSGRRARDRASRFKREYPNSLFMPAVDSALDETKAPLH
jgi:hypothetical protein